MNETCTCGRLYVGATVTEARNWSPDCGLHGLDSEWYRSPARVAKRAEDSERLRDLQRQAREARARAAEQAAAANPEEDQ